MHKVKTPSVSISLHFCHSDIDEDSELKMPGCSGISNVHADFNANWFIIAHNISRCNWMR